MPRPFEIIAAEANNRVIGYKGQLPWGHTPRDLKHFKDLTMGHAVIVGFNTIVSISEMVKRHTNILPGRHIYVLTRNPNKMQQFPDCIMLESIDDAIRICERDRVFIAGGEDVYHQFINLPQTRTIHMTRIFANYHGDAFFPILQNGDWESINATFYDAGKENKHAMRFTTLIRV